MVEAVGSSPVTQTNIKAHRKLAFQWAFLLYIHSPALHGEKVVYLCRCDFFRRLKMGYIYIFTNPSFPQYVKIGYAKDVKQRLDELNRSTAVPFAFRIYATYEVDSELSDKRLHSILDKLNPDLRSAEEIDGKKRTREFYAMSPEDAFSILEAISEINNYRNRLKKWKASANEQRDEELAQEINTLHCDRMSNLTFSKCNIEPGEQIEFCCKGNSHSGELCEVVDDKHIKYSGEIWSLTALAKYFTKSKSALSGPRYFKYNGEWLNDIRQRLGK